MDYVKPQVPLKYTDENGLEHYEYPLTTSDQIIKPNGERFQLKTSELENDSNFTTNKGTVTSVAVKINGSTKGTITTSGTIDLGNVGIQIDLLWTNSSGTSSFGGQTISLGLADYKFVIIEATNMTSSVSYYSNTTPFSYVYPVDGRARYIGSMYNLFARRVVTVKTNGVTFDNAIRINSYNSNNVNTDNIYIIPQRIWGIK